MAKDGDLAMAVLIYGVGCVEDGALDQLIALGCGPCEIEDLSRLKLMDIQRIDRLKWHCLNIDLDKDALAAMVGPNAPTDRRLGKWDRREDLALAVLVYTMRCVEDGDGETLLEMGFGAEEVERLSRLDLADIRRIGKPIWDCLNIKLNKDVLQR